MSGNLSRQEHQRPLEYSMLESDRNPFRIDTGQTARKYISVKAKNHELQSNKLERDLASLPISRYLQFCTRDHCAAEEHPYYLFTISQSGQ